MEPVHTNTNIHRPTSFILMLGGWMFPLKVSHPPCGSDVGSVLTLRLWPRTSVWLDLLKTLNVDMAADKRGETRQGKEVWASQSETGEKGEGNYLKLRQSLVTEPKGGFTVILPRKKVCVCIWKGWSLLTCLCCLLVLLKENAWGALSAIHNDG